MDSGKRDLRTSLRHHQTEAEAYHQYRDESGSGPDRGDPDSQPVIEVSAGEVSNYDSPGTGHGTGKESEDLSQKFEDAVTLQPSLDR
jgi:hypothetical protein